MLKTITALSFGFLLLGAAAADASEPRRTLVYKLRAHRAVHHETVDPRTHEVAPVIGPELRMGVSPRATSPAPGMAVKDPPPTNEGCLWGLNRYNGVSCP